MIWVFLRAFPFGSLHLCDYVASSEIKNKSEVISTPLPRLSLSLSLSRRCLIAEGAEVDVAVLVGGQELKDVEVALRAGDADEGLGGSSTRRRDGDLAVRAPLEQRHCTAEGHALYISLLNQISSFSIYM